MIRSENTANHTVRSYARDPFIVFYEVTRACDLTCEHCRAAAQPRAHRKQLSTAWAKRLLEQFASFDQPPMVVLSGGDPIKRTDLNQLIDHGVTRLGLRVALSPSVTPLLTRDVMQDWANRGVKRISLSLDGATAETHDAFRGFAGSFERTLQCIDEATSAGLSVQINTTITATTVNELDAIAALLHRHDVTMWSAFFLIGVGRGRSGVSIAPAEYEDVFAKLKHIADEARFMVKTTEAHHYRRYVLENREATQAEPTAHPMAGHRAPTGIRDGHGIMFVSHTGEIYPSGFLPLRCGQVPLDNVVDVYRDHEVFQRLRQVEDFAGKCGRCEYREICGGSRARAYAMTGNAFASDPHCVYQPAASSN